jgi:hypothetical protein
MGLFNRFVNIEKWMLETKWKETSLKKVCHKHFTGNDNNLMMVRKDKSKSMAVVIPDNAKYEIIRKFEVAKINKAVNYLKWTRNRFKLSEGEVKLPDILELNLQNQSFGCQRDENKFIMWKHVVKWKIYAEILIDENMLLFESFGKK